MNRIMSILCVPLAVCAVNAPASAEKLGVGGTGVDVASSMPTCDKPFGTVALDEEKAKSDPRRDAMPALLRAMMKMAQAQQGGGGSVDPLPLLKLHVARSHCFPLVDHGAGFNAIQRERTLAAGTGPSGIQGASAAAPALQSADYMLVA